jgi:hypothetical protein
VGAGEVPGFSLPVLLWLRILYLLHVFFLLLLYPDCADPPLLLFLRLVVAFCNKVYARVTLSQRPVSTYCMLSVAPRSYALRL